MENNEAESIDIAIGRRLTALRETAGLTRTELAAQSGLSLMSLINYETGHTRLGAVDMQKLCTPLNAKPAELLRNIKTDGRQGRSLHDASESFED